jgi:hypothetical protein
MIMVIPSRANWSNGSPSEYANVPRFSPNSGTSFKASHAYSRILKRLSKDAADRSFDPSGPVVEGNDRDD